MDLGPVGQRWMMHTGGVYYCTQESRSLVPSSTTAPIMQLKLNHQLIRGFADILILELFRILLSMLGLHHKWEIDELIERIEWLPPDLAIFKVSPPVVVVLPAEVIFCRKVSFESLAADSSGWAIVVRRGFCKILRLRATFHKSWINFSKSFWAFLLFRESSPLSLFNSHHHHPCHSFD